MSLTSHLPRLTSAGVGLLPPRPASPCMRAAVLVYAAGGGTTGRRRVFSSWAWSDSPNAAQGAGLPVRSSTAGLPAAVAPVFRRGLHPWDRCVTVFRVPGAFVGVEEDSSALSPLRAYMTTFRRVL